ncbi:MAG TPA: hypothetical protein VH593_03145 [Ktedonobacteraceae bacterium]
MTTSQYPPAKAGSLHLDSTAILHPASKHTALASASDALGVIDSTPSCSRPARARALIDHERFIWAWLLAQNPAVQLCKYRGRNHLSPASRSALSPEATILDFTDVVK